MAVVVSIDAGTTGVRSFALNEAGEQVAIAYREFTQLYPQPGWVEHDPEDIWKAVQATLADLVSLINEPIAAIGITDQRETVWLGISKTALLSATPSSGRIDGLPTAALS